MTRRTAVLLALALGLAWPGPAARAQKKGPKDEAGWKSLFDGKSLAGWKPSFEDNSGTVHVKAGAIGVGKGMKMSGVA